MKETDVLTILLAGTTTACRRHTSATTPIPPTVRRRHRCRPLPTNRKSRIPILLPAQRSADSWRSSVPTYRILTSAIPRRTPSSRLRSHTITIPPTTNTHRLQHPSSTGKPAHPSRTPPTPRFRRTVSQLSADAANAHGPPDPSRPRHQRCIHERRRQ